MDKRRIFRLVLVPLAVGLVVTALVYRYVDATRPDAAAPVLVDVVIARAPIPARTTLTREHLTTRQVPQAYVGRGELNSLDEVVGQVTTVALAEGESVLRSKLGNPQTPTALAFRIPPGRRAITIKVSETSGVGGFPEPGDLVDVLATFAKEIGGVDKTRLVLESAPVLAAGARTETRDSLKDVKPLTSLTLAVTPDEAARLTLAEERGSLRVLLRPARPEQPVGELEYTVRAFGAPVVAPQPVAR